MTEGCHTLCPCVCGLLTQLHSPDHVPVLVSHGWKVAVASCDREDWGEEAWCLAVLPGGGGARVPGVAGHQLWGALSSLLPSLGVILGTHMPVGT